MSRRKSSVASDATEKQTSCGPDSVPSFREAKIKHRGLGIVITVIMFNTIGSQKMDRELCLRIKEATSERRSELGCKG